MKVHKYVLCIEADTEEQALTVLCERLAHDEEYGDGFFYRIWEEGTIDA